MRALKGHEVDPAALQALFDPDGERPVPTLDAVFEGLADYIEQHFEPGVLAQVKPQETELAAAKPWWKLW